MMKKTVRPYHGQDVEKGGLKTMLYTLKNNSAMLQIDSLGAEIKSFKDVFGTEYMGPATPPIGSAAPVLFRLLAACATKPQ
ncbi:MAG: hypothetical protein ACLSAP_06155 [Oscillospiraceae bacterium]